MHNFLYNPSFDLMLDLVFHFKVFISVTETKYNPQFHFQHYKLWKHSEWFCEVHVPILYVLLRYDEIFVLVKYQNWKLKDVHDKNTHTLRCKKKTQKTNIKTFSKEFKMLHRWFFIIHVNEGQMIFILVNSCNFPPYQIFNWPHC